MFNQIGQPRFNSPLVRFFGMKIAGAAAPSLAPEIAPSFEVNQMDDVTLPFLRNEKLLLSTRAEPGVAAQFTRIRFRNPANSGVLFIVEQLNVICAQGVQYGSTAAVTDEATVLRLNQADTRWTNASTTLQSSGTNAALITDTTFGTFNGNDTNTVRKLGLVIAPGFAFWLQCTTVLTALTVNIWARERAITAEELATG